MARFETDLTCDEAVAFDTAFNRFVRDELSALDFVGLKLFSFSPRPGVERRVVVMPTDETLEDFKRYRDRGSPADLAASAEP